MPTISCEVTKCCYNKDGGCRLERVNVGGENAVVSVETMCDSFTDCKEDAMTNSCDCENEACDCAEIDCEAENCRYNENGECEAERIEVGKCSSCCCSETECETFEEK